MSLNFANISNIWLLIILGINIAIIMVFIFIKKEKYKTQLSIIISLILILINTMVIDSLYNLIFLLLLVFNLTYFLLFILKPKIIESKNANIIFKETVDSIEKSNKEKSNNSVKHIKGASS